MVDVVQLILQVPDEATSAKSISVTNVDDQYQLGTSSALKTVRDAFDKDKREQEIKLARLTPSPTYGSLQQYHNQMVQRVKAYSKQINRLDKAISGLKKGMRGAALMTLLGPFAALAAVGAGFAAIILRIISDKLKKKKKSLEQSKYLVETDFSGVNCWQPAPYERKLFNFKNRPRRARKWKQSGSATRFTKFCETLRGYIHNIHRETAVCNSKNPICPENMRFAEKLLQKVPPIEKIIKDRTDKIEKLDKHIEKIRTTKITSLKNVLMNGKFELINIPYQALSYDDKFYIPL